METRIKIYSYRRCPFAMRVRIALHEKKIPFEVIEEDLKNFSPELRALHPEAKVPLLVHGENVIYESAIITEYVDDLPSIEKKLMPASPAERAQVRLWTYWCNQVFKPDLDRFKYGTARFPEGECQGIEMKMIQHLQKLEAVLVRQGHLVGSEFSLADVHVFPFVRQLSRIQPEPAFVKKHPALCKWRDSIQKRPSVWETLKK
ncbi:glutathione S-transferase family protein [bacterium]|nr:glutathione S-transferase family protein [bacterium]